MICDMAGAYVDWLRHDCAAALQRRNMAMILKVRACRVQMPPIVRLLSDTISM